MPAGTFPPFGGYFLYDPRMPPPSRRSSPTAFGGRRQAAVPAFALYGETGAPDGQLLHIEPIAARSARYRWEIGAHRHQGLCQAVWLDAGAVRVSLDEWQATLEAPAAILLPPGVVHAFRFVAGAQGWVLSFSPRRLLEGAEQTVAARLEERLGQPALLAWSADDPLARRLGAMLALLATEFDASAGCAPTVAWVARSAVWLLAEAPQQQVRPTRARALQAPLYTRFVHLVEQHHAAHWPMTRYAQALGLSVERLNRLTRAETGRTAQQLVHERLLREAQRQLLYTGWPVSKIGFQLGFEDPAYFARFFRRGVGCSPGTWRALQLESAPVPEGGPAERP